MVLGARGKVSWFDARAWALLGAVVLTASCGESSDNRRTPTGTAGQNSRGSGGSGGATGGTGGSMSGGGGTAGSSAAGGGSGGTGGAGGSSGTPGTGGATGGNTTGGSGGAGGEGASSSGSGGTGGGASGEAGTGGAGGMREPDGFICGSPERCDPGEICTGCTTSQGTDFICVPHPEDDPAGFATATEDCEDGAGDHFAECDGPEDCPAGEFCVWGDDAQASYGGQCVTDGDLPQTASCCFTCGALPVCILCETDADCPENRECTEVLGAPSGINGCLPP